MFPFPSLPYWAPTMTSTHRSTPSGKRPRPAVARASRDAGSELCVSRMRSAIEPRSPDISLRTVLLGLIVAGELLKFRIPGQISLSQHADRSSQMDVEDPAAEVTPKMIDLLFRPYRIDQPNMIVELAGTFGEKLVQD